MVIYGILLKPTLILFRTVGIQTLLSRMKLTKSLPYLLLLRVADP